MQLFSASLALCCHRWIPTQRASNAENVSIWWCHHDDPLKQLSINQLQIALFHHNAIWINSERLKSTMQIAARTTSIIPGSEVVSQIWHFEHITKKDVDCVCGWFLHESLASAWFCFFARVWYQYDILVYHSLCNWRVLINDNVDVSFALLVRRICTYIGTIRSYIIIL